MQCLAGMGLVVWFLIGAACADETNFDQVNQLSARLDRLEQQNKQLAAQNQQLRGMVGVSLAAHANTTSDAVGIASVDSQSAGDPQVFATGAMQIAPPGAPVAQVPALELPQEDIERVVADYLKNHPGAGAPYGVQTGYSAGRGFVIRSIPDPNWGNNWGDAMKSFPFELRIRGRVQLAYYNFHPSNNETYTGSRAPFVPSDTNGGRRADLNAFEVKRMRLIFEGTAYDPNLKYRMQLNGDTRGLSGNFNDNVMSSGSPKGALTDSGGVTIDNAVRLYEAWVSYDFHPDVGLGGSTCNPDYRPTVTAIGGKLKPFCALEEYLGSGANQFVEYSMADWFFSPEDDNLLNGAGAMVKAYDDRLYMMALATNGSESNYAVGQMEDYLGFNAGFWYDFGGTWNESAKAWQLYGDSTSDIDYSRNPVVRVGAGITANPMDRRKLYGDAEQGRFRTAVGGAKFIDIFNSGSFGDSNYSIDRFDAYIVNAFAAAKYQGFSIYNEWWVRQLTNFQSVGGNPILYNAYLNGSTAATLAKLNVNNMVDTGMLLQCGYFLIPTKLELIGRWSMVAGQSGSINGDGTQVGTTTVNGKSVAIVKDAFRKMDVANEYTMGVNVYFRKHLLKWQSDVGYYQGGNPSGASAAGFGTGVDGWLVRTQVQLAF